MIGRPLLQSLEDFRRKYDPRDPIRPQVEDWEIRQLSPKDGLNLLGPAPAIGVEFGAPPTGIGDGRSRYLWIIDTTGIPYIFERPLETLVGNLPKHSNLSGGSAAYVGGELWFITGHEIYISGGSGRYPPRNQYQLEDACDVFESFNYNVNSLGWDGQAGRAKRNLE